MGYAGAILAIAGAAASYAQASSQNKAIRNTARLTQAAGAVQARQVSDAAAVESLKRANEAERIKGRLRVAAAAAGLGVEGGSYGDLIQQDNYDAALNQTILETNRRNEVARVQSGVAANLAGLQSHIQNLILSSVGGGVQGAQAGIAIGGAFPSTPSASTPGPNVGGTGGLASYGYDNGLRIT